MLDFYDAAFKSGDAPQALADTQRAWLVKLRKRARITSSCSTRRPVHYVVAG